MSALSCELRVEPVYLTGHFDRVERFTATLSTEDEGRAMRATLRALGTRDPEVWGGLARRSWTATASRSHEAMHQGLAAAGLPHKVRQRWLRTLGLRYVDPELQRSWSASPCEWHARALWPSTLLRRIWTVPMPDAKTLVIAVASRPQPVPGRSPLALVGGPALVSMSVGLTWWCDQQRWRQDLTQWNLWEPAGTRTRHGVSWLCPSPPPTTGILPEATLLQGNAHAKTRWVHVQRGSSDEATHRAAVLAVARAQVSEHPQKSLLASSPMDEARLEGIRVPWRLLREVYDRADKMSVYSGRPRMGDRWSDIHWPRPRKPGLVFRWSGLWNPGWHHGYEWWGCHVWTAEWRDERAEAREICVVVDVQTD